MRAPQKRRCNAYVYAVLVSLAALVIYAAVDRGSHVPPLMVLLELPVIISAYLGGLGPGLTATLITAVGADYLLFSGNYTLALPSDVEALRWAGFVIVGVVISALSEALHISTARADASHEKADQAFRERSHLQQLLARIAETAPGVICAYRLWPDGRSAYPYASAAIADIYGLPPEAIADDASAALARIHPEDIEFIRETASASARTMTPWTAEFRVLHPTRGEIWVESHSTPQLEDDGSTLWLGFLNDVSQRKWAEAALYASEERVRDITETISEVFWLSNAEKTQIQYVSRAYETIWGRSCEALYASGRDWVEAIHPDDRTRVLDAAVTKPCDGPYDEEYRIIRPDGVVRWIRDRAFPVKDLAGNIIRIAGIAEDITERRTLEAQLMQAQKMESIGQLAGGVAHDFNNFLTVILGSAQLLESAVEHDRLAAQLVEEIRAAGERATSLTRQLLAFSRKDLAEPRVLDFNTVISDTHKMFRRLLGEDVLLTLTLDHKVGCAFIDPGQWVQVLMNLAVNARDAMPRGGQLTIETSAVELRDHAVDGLAAGPYVKLSVTDTGSGITPDVRSHIFEPFFTTKQVNRGTGLGLAVVYGIVKQSGGHIEADSEPGHGTTFRIWVPIAEARAQVTADTDGPRVDGTETILVVEDDATVRRLAVRGLSGRGYHVIEAADGLQATQLLEKNIAVDLMVTDVVMPGINGRELADAVHLLRPNLKVIYTSGYTTDDVVRRGVEASKVAFLPKPYEPQSLAAKVRGVLDQTAA